MFVKVHIDFGSLLATCRLVFTELGCMLFIQVTSDFVKLGVCRHVLVDFWDFCCLCRLI